MRRMIAGPKKHHARSARERSADARALGGRSLKMLFEFVSGLLQVYTDAA
jgi:hypothetical protein